MLTTLVTPNNLEPRFTPPENWRIESFNRDGRKIFYRTAFIDTPKGIVFCLPGLSEFSEKYIETSRQLNDEGFNVVVIDWTYQGLSSRFESNPHKRYSDGYEADIADLHYLITGEIKSDLPHYMLAHSMGGHIGLRFLSMYPDMFKVASFSAPMVGIKIIRHLLRLKSCLMPFLKNKRDRYVPGGHDWSALDRHDVVSDIFTHDEIRKKIQNKWCIANPELQVGSPTFKWIEESMNSIKILQSNDTLNKITAPVFIALAGKEKLVDNKAIRKAIPHLPNATLKEYQSAKHEILMERDEVRDDFMAETLEIFS